MAVEEVYPLIQLDAGGGGVPESFEGVGDVARRELEACFFEDTLGVYEGAVLGREGKVVLGGAERLAGGC